MTDPLVLAYLYPAAVATIDYAVSAGQISRWNAAKLGAPPTDQQLADAVASIGYQAWLLAAYKAVKVAAIRANKIGRAHV